MGKRFNCQCNKTLIENTNVMGRKYNRIYIMILHRTMYQDITLYSTQLLQNNPYSKLFILIS